MTDEPTRSMNASAGDNVKPDPFVGTTVGERYRILGQIGEGAFGIVYEAEQKTPVTRRVAIKVIKPGMDSKAVVARFKAEEQALAVMNHPGIAKVLDAGETERGLPFFAMELVKGEPVTDFCDRHTLSINQRLELMIEIAHAVQHAHTKGVIHRDLKPSNILVGYDDEGKPRPKVIDFGVAKALNQRLTEQTVFTDRGQLIGTPEYMSPEQAEMSGVDIDTRADVYSLGILLYELLTGVRPFDLQQAAFHEIQRVIRETEPQKPSTRLSTMLTKPSEFESASRIIKVRRTDPRALTGVLKRDLDWVVMKSLEKDRERRYETSNALADDIHRFIHGEVVRAGPPTRGYRLKKFITRNKTFVGVAATVTILLSLGLAGTTYGLYEADSQARRAQLSEAEANKKRLLAEWEATKLRALSQRTDAIRIVVAKEYRLLNADASGDKVEGIHAVLRRTMPVIDKLLKNNSVNEKHLGASIKELFIASMKPLLLETDILTTEPDMVWLMLSWSREAYESRAKAELNTATLLSGRDLMEMFTYAKLHPKAIELGNEMLTRIVRVYGDDSIQYAEISRALASVYHHAWRNDDAMEALAHTIRIETEYLGSPTPETSELHTKLMRARSN